jgi:DNA polymerase-3 subunit alpha
VLEALVASGAFDSLRTERSLLYAAIPDAMQAAEQHEHNQNAGMVDLFGNLESVNSPPAMQEDSYSRYRHLKPLTLQQRLQSEKDVLGLYVTGHPMDAYKAELACFIRRNLDQLVPTKKPCWIAGLVVARRTVKNRHGNNIAFITLDDLKARVEVALFTEVYDQYYEYVQIGQLLVIEGDVSADDYSGGLKATARQILNMAQARAYFAGSLRLELTTNYLRQHGSKQLQQLLSTRQVNNDGPASRLYLGISNGHVRGLIDCASSWQLQVDDDLLMELEDLLGADAVLMDYQRVSGSQDIDRLY